MGSAVIYYDTVGPGVSRLHRWILDGRNEAELLVERAVRAYESDLSYAYRFWLSPDATLAIRTAPVTDTSWDVEAIDLATGVTRWTAVSEVPVYRLGWSADGRWALGPSTDREPRRAPLIDTQTGAIRLVAPPSETSILGFAQTGDHVVLIGHTETTGRPVFFDWDVFGGPVEPILLRQAAVADSYFGGSSFSAKRGVTIEHRYRESGEAVVLRDYVSGLESRIKGLPDSTDDMFVGSYQFDPSGAHIFAISKGRDEAGVSGQSSVGLYAATPPSPAALIWQGRGSGFMDIAFSHDGGLVAFQAHYGLPELNVVEVATGRALSLPIPPATFGLTVARIIGTGPLPDGVPSPSPLPTPSPTDLPEAIAGAPRIVIVKSIDVDGGIAATFSLLAPLRGGTLATVATTTLPIRGALSGEEASAEAVARPNSDEILLWTGANGSYDQWLWTPGDEPVPLDLPSDIGSSHLLWSLDGTRVIGPPYAGGALAWFDFDSGAHGKVRLPRAWRSTFTVGITADGLVLLQEEPYTDSPMPCRGAYRRTFDLESGLVAPYEPAEDVVASARTPGFSAASGYSADIDPGGATITLDRNCATDTDDVSLALPLGATALRADWSPDGLSLLVQADTFRGRVLYRYERPWLDPARPPDTIAALPTTIERIDEFTGDGRWAILDGLRTIGCVQAGLLDTESGTVYRTDLCGGRRTWLP
jgi:hypothetical protein